MSEPTTEELIKWINQGVENKNTLTTSLAVMLEDRLQSQQQVIDDAITALEVYADKGNWDGSSLRISCNAYVIAQNAISKLKGAQGE